MKLKKTLAGVAAAAVAASSLSVITFADDAATVSGEDYMAFLESIKSMSATLEVREIAPEATGEKALGFAGFYIQNKGGSWDWFACDEETTDITAPGTYEVAWTDVQSIIGETRGDKTKYKLYTPVEEWEDYPTLGIQVGSNYITEADVEGKVDASITGVTLELLDGTIVELGDYEAVADLKGKQEDWGISGNNVAIAFDNDVKAYIAANSEVDDPTTGDEPKLPTTYTATLGFASSDWAAQDWATSVDIDKDGTYTLTATFAPGEDGTVPSVAGAKVFVIDIAKLGADLGIDPDGDDYDMTKCTVSDVKVMCGDTEIAIDQSKILWGDPEDKGNLRIELFNAWGSTAVAEQYDASVSPLNPADIVCSSGEALVVSFTITGLEDALNNTTDVPTPGDSPAIDDPTTDDPTTDDPTTDDPTTDDPTTDDPTTDDPTTDDPTTDDPTTDVPTDVDPGTSSGGNLPTGGALAVVPVALAAGALLTAGIVLKKRSK